MASTTTTTTTTQVYKDTYGQDFTPPDFTIKDILDAIPKRCYERSYLRSYSYVARDLACIAAVFYLGTKIQLLPSVGLRFVAWTLYTIVQGLFGTGIWVLAHECGHGAFSPSRLVNDITGWILHSALFVPYHSWRITHSKHHKATGHLQRDMVFVPKDQERYLQSREILELAEEAPIISLYWLVVQQLFGWPTYLAINVTGQKYNGASKWYMSHFNPVAPMFDPKDFWDVIVSDVGMLCAGYLSYLAIHNFGWANYILFYFIPYLWVNHWLVFITYLQHTDPCLPHYDAAEWNFARGAAATIDRDFGFVGRHIFHEIIETHVAHHYVSRIPFYHGEEATEAIKRVMGKHYRRDTTNMFVALWRAVRMCQFVEGTEGVKMYRNGNGYGPKPEHLVLKEKAN
ncbi:fatty acid desaturase-domain-containing protein [Lipomyces oligophaga]|uniref:fatty acid desaturase-domain-containing protein n=1 Tax=Lipomyces oligophaga TaxID=45792 RepID=UPI0034CEF66D